MNHNDKPTEGGIRALIVLDFSVLMSSDANKLSLYLVGLPSNTDTPLALFAK